MSRLLCCLRARRPDMGAALSHPQEGEACDGPGGSAAPPTMADVIRERKKKAGSAGLGTLRRRLAHAARRPRDNRPDRGCEHARFIRSVVSSWRLSEVFLLCEELEAGAALRDLLTRAELARSPAPALNTALPAMRRDRWWCDVELVGAGWAVWAHRAVLAARSHALRELLLRYPPSCTRVPLEGACARVSRAEAEACINAMYSGLPPSTTCAVHKCESDESSVGAVSAAARCTCSMPRGSCRRSQSPFAVSTDPLGVSMRYLLDSGEMCDAKLVFVAEGGGAAYGFSSALEIPVHKVILAARSRYFKSVLSRGVGGGAVCVDEKVLPRRFARALLHAAYTDQVDLSLIGRNSSSPSSTVSNTGWGVGRGCKPTTSMLDDAFQLYEIARFLEMPIVSQGCEDAVAEALSADNLAHVLRWCSQPHASQWLHRQAMRYLRDEFVSIVSAAGSSSIPPSALAAALSSPFLQASEHGALRALLRWAADHKHKQREPNVVWHTGGTRRRRSLGESTTRELLAPLLALVRLEHLPRDELPPQLVRRGILPGSAVAGGSEAGSAHAWLGRGSCRPARIFLPYLDEIKALLEDQAVPEAELARARRARYMQRIPDTLYMVASGREPAPASPPGAAAARACVPPRAAAALRARVRELRASPPARAAAALPHHVHTVNTQIALRAVREMSLPDACADLLLHDIDDDVSQSSSCGWGEGEAAGEDRAWNEPGPLLDCCRTSNQPAAAAARSSADNSRNSTCARRDTPPRGDTTQHRSSSSGSGSSRGQLSAAVPDVAMAPNANTHLLTPRDYWRHAPPCHYGGVVLQLDLGDGATHTPRPGSRAQRNSASGSVPNRSRELAHNMSCLRRADDDELRAAIEMTVMRAYSFPRNTSPPRAPCRGEMLQPEVVPGRPRVSRASPRESAQLNPVARVSPSRRRDLRLHEYRVEGGSLGSSSTSRGHSPNNYA